MPEAPQQSVPESRMWIRILLLVVLFTIAFWSYQQYSLNYAIIERSNALSERLLAEQAALSQATGQELNLVKENLLKTEALLNKLQLENEKLHRKIKILDRVSELEATISRLKEKNARIINHMSSMKTDAGPVKVKSLQDGRSMISKLKERLRAVKTGIRDLKRKERDQKKAAQQDQDRLESKLGNNGYLVRDGTAQAMDLKISSGTPSVKIEVEFVK